VRDKRHALLWAIGWWILRRQVRRRAAVALAGLGMAATPRRGRGLLAVLTLIILTIGALVAWRRLAGSNDGWGEPPLDPVAASEPHPPVAA